MDKKGINKIVRMKKVILCSIILFGFVSCETWYEKLIGNYYLLAIDSMSEMRVSYYDKGMDLDISYYVFRSVEQPKTIRNIQA